MRIAVCDDSAIDRQTIALLLNRYFSDKNLNYKLSQYENTGSLLTDIEDGKCFDLIILDMYIGSMLGINFARKLRAMSYNGFILFASISDRFAVDSYDVWASGYLLKPFRYEKLTGVMDHILNDHRDPVFQIKSRSNILYIPFPAILYVDSRNSKCFVHCANGEVHTVYRRLDEIEADLSDRRFLRCHQSYLVNMDFIQSVTTEFTLTTGDVVLIRKRSLKAIRDAYFNYTKSSSISDN